MDLNGDGRLDLVTGKRFMAHNGSDPGEREPLGLYWYESRPCRSRRAGRAAGSRMDPARHRATAAASAPGMQIPVVDIDGDGDLDIVCPGKSGLFWLENLTRRSESGFEP